MSKVHYQQERRGQRGVGIVAQTRRRKNRKSGTAKKEVRKKERKFHLVPTANLTASMKDGILKHCKQAIDIDCKCFLRERQGELGKYILFQMNGENVEVIAIGGERLKELLY